MYRIFPGPREYSGKGGGWCRYDVVEKNGRLLTGYIEVTGYKQKELTVRTCHENQCVDGRHPAWLDYRTRVQRWKQVRAA